MKTIKCDDCGASVKLIAIPGIFLNLYRGKCRKCNAVTFIKVEKERVGIKGEGGENDGSQV